MKKLLSIILATAMIVTLFCVVPASAETVTLDSTYFFDDFESGTTTISAKTNIAGSTATEIIDGTSYGRTGKVWSYTYPKTNASGGNYYADIVIPNVLTDDKADLKDCAVGTTIKVTFDYKFTTTPTTNVTAMEAWIIDSSWKAPGSGSKTAAELADWNTATIEYTIANALHSPAANSTDLSLRLAQPFTRTQILIDNLEFIKINPSAGGTAPAVSNVDAIINTDGGLDIDYDYSSTASDATADDKSVIKLYDDSILVRAYDASDAITVPEANRASKKLKIKILPISATGRFGTETEAIAVSRLTDFYYIGTNKTVAATSTGVAIAPDVAANGQLIINYKASAISTGSKLVLSYGSTSEEVALEAGRAVAIDKGTADYSDLSIKVVGDGDVVFDYFEVKIVKAGSAAKAPVISDVAVLTDTATGEVDVNYTVDDETNDMSIVKVFDGTELLGAYRLAAGETIVALEGAHKTSGYINVTVVPMSAFGHIGSETVATYIPYVIVPDITWGSENVTATVSIVVNDEENILYTGDIVAILAIYDAENGAMVGIAPVNTPAQDTDRSDFTLNLSAEIPEDGTVAKVFVWSGTDLASAGEEVYNSVYTEAIPAE